MAAIDQAARDKKVQERRAANKKRAEEKKAAKAKKSALKKSLKKHYGKEEKKHKAASKKMRGTTLKERAESYKKYRAEKKARKASVKKETALRGTKAAKSIKGEVSPGLKGVKETKGGGYAKYGKKSETAKSFRSAFKEAGGKDFTWQGRKYSGKRADDKKVAPKGKGKTFGKEGIKKVAKKSTDVSDKLQYQTPIKDVIDTKDRLAKRGKYREDSKVPEKKDKKPTYEELSAKITSPKKMEGGGKVESNPYGWPSSDSRKR